MNATLTEIDFTMGVRCTLTNKKANSLFWLGRYAERVYLSLHLLRKFYDSDIEASSSTAYELYCKQLHIAFNALTPAKDIAKLLYDGEISNSLISGLKFANDNALVLRGELTSETLSYIQIANYHMQACQAINEENITVLQQITDSLLAFWGSAQERILSDTVRDFLFLGKYIERLDMEIRFGYSRERIIKTYYKVRKLVVDLKKACDENVVAKLDELVIAKSTVQDDSFNNLEILQALEGLFQI